MEELCVYDAVEKCGEDGYRYHEPELRQRQDGLLHICLRLFKIAGVVSK